MALDPSIIQSANQSMSALANGISSAADSYVNAKSQGLKNKLAQAQLTQAQNQVNDQRAVRNAYKNNLATDASGNVSLNQQGFLNELSKTAPTQVIPQQMQMAQHRAEMQKYQLDQANAKLDFAGRMAGSVKDEQSYQSFLNGMQAMGFSTSQYQPNYTPGYEQTIQKEALGAKDQIANLIAQRDSQSKALSAAAQAAEAGLPVPRGFLGGISGGGQPQGGAPGAAPASGAGTKGGGAASASGTASNVPQLSSVDPSQLVNSHVPMKLRDKAFEDIKDAQNITNIAQKSLDAFDQAAKEVRPMTAGTGTSLTAFVPRMESPGQKIWQGLANTTVKGVEGTARQAAFDSLKKNFMPQFGDSDATIAQKRTGYINYLKSHLSSPTNKGNGIDLSKFASTSLPDNFGQMSQTKAPAIVQGATKIYNNKTYKVVGDQWVAQPDDKQAAK